MKEKERFIELRAQGWSFDRIAKELNRAKQTLINWSKELKDEIANRRALELESLYEKYYLLKEHRLSSFGEMLQKMREELLSRDLSEVPTDKLLELLLKYDTYIREEIVEPIYKSSQELEEEATDRAILEGLTSLEPQPLRKLKAG